jgi:hypothetical protein
MVASANRARRTETTPDAGRDTGRRVGRPIGRPAPREAVQQYTKLVRLATASKSPEGLVSAASAQLGRPLVLLDLDGIPLAAAPPSPRPSPSTVRPSPAAEALRNTPGWRVVPIENDEERLGFLAVGSSDTQEPERGDTLDLIVSLLGDLLQRTALVSTVRRERQASFTRRLVTDHTVTTSTIRSEAKAAGLRLADSYWPTLLVWMAGHPGPRTLAEVGGEARVQAPGSLTVGLDNATVPVLYPAGASGVAERREVDRLLAHLVRHAHRLGHCDVCGIADERSAGVALLPERVDRLEHLRHYVPCVASQATVLPAGSFALECLLGEGLDRRRAVAYVHERLGPLLRHDLDHGTDLARELELALDYPRRDEAARATYMHRNTLRRHLAQALELAKANLDDPHDRFALHVALKLRRLLMISESAGNDVPDAATIRSPAQPRAASLGHA